MRPDSDRFVIRHAGLSEPGGEESGEESGEGRDMKLPGGVNARSLASRGSLRSMTDLQSPEPPREPQGKLFRELPSQPSHSGSLVPSLDEKLDQAHRFTLLGRIFGPISDFIRKTLGSAFRGDSSKDHSSKE